MNTKPTTAEAAERLPTLGGLAPRLLIVDDHDTFRADARELLESVGCTVVGEAADAAAAIAEARRLKPDVVLLDIQLPDRDGFAVAADIANEPQPPQIIFISSREAADYGSRLRTSVAAGFIHKPELSRALVTQLIGCAG